jgi:hypothetical protein
MRVALILYGQPRDYLSGYNTIKQYCNSQANVDFDFFYHCWTVPYGDKYSVSPWRTIVASLYLEESVPKQLLELYNPKGYEYEEQHTFDAFQYKNTLAYLNTTGAKMLNISNTLSQLYSRNKARDILDKHIKAGAHYDYVITTRFDIRSMPRINLCQMDQSKTHVSNQHLPRKILPDNCIITSPEKYLKLFNIYNELNHLMDSKELSDKMNLLGEKLEINPEELLLANYIRHCKSLDISYFSGGLVE